VLRGPEKNLNRFRGDRPDAHRCSIGVLINTWFCKSKTYANTLLS
jgi:hypothetical protein